MRRRLKLLMFFVSCILILQHGILFSGEIKVYPGPFDQKVILETDFQRIVFDRDDTAKIVGWRFNGKEFVNYPEKGYGLAKSTLWSPRRLHFKFQPYLLTGKSVKDGVITLKFQGKVDMCLIKMGPLAKEGWLIEKTYTIMANSPEITVDHKITNAGKKPLYFSFWFHNWLNFGADYILFLPGQNDVISCPLVPMTNPSEIVFPVENAPYTRGNEKFEKKLRLETIGKGNFIIYSENTKEAFMVKTDYDKLLQEYTNFSGNPTLEFMTQPCTLKIGDTWRMRTKISFQTGLERDEVEKSIAGY